MPKRNPEYESLAARLRDHPGEWELLGEYPTRTLYQSWESGALVALRPELGFTVRALKQPTGSYFLWGQYDPANALSADAAAKAREKRLSRRRKPRSEASA